jgi:hypothetical protein
MPVPARILDLQDGRCISLSLSTKFNSQSISILDFRIAQTEPRRLYECRMCKNDKARAMDYSSATAHRKSNIHQSRLRFRQNACSQPVLPRRPPSSTFLASQPPENSPIFDVPMVEHNTDSFAQKFEEEARRSYLLEQFGHLGLDDDDDEEDEAAQAQFDQELFNMFAPPAPDSSADWSPFKSRAVS